MRKTIVTVLTAVAVVLAGLAVTVPAEATKGNSNPKVCTQREYDALKNNLTLKRVNRILDGRGKVVSRTEHTMYREYGNMFKRGVFVGFDRNKKGKPWRLMEKQAGNAIPFFVIYPSKWRGEGSV